MTDSIPRSTRRWFRFSLRSLLLAMVVVSAAGGWVILRVQRAADNRAAARAERERVDELVDDINRPPWDVKELNPLALIGGPLPRPTVGADYVPLRHPTLLERLFDDPGSPVDPILRYRIREGDFPCEYTSRLEQIKGHADLASLSMWNGGHTDVVLEGASAEIKHLRELNLNLSDVSDRGLASLRRLDQLQELHLYYTAVTDAGLLHLRELRSLEKLVLQHTAVTDAGLLHLRDLDNLKDLNLESTAVTDVGLRRLSGLSDLRRLDITDTSVTDAGMVHLSVLSNLRDLDLTFTDVTDAGLAQLHGLRRLRRIGLSNHITDAGRKQLQVALPNCTIE